MKKLIIFDLQDTLVSKDKKLIDNFRMLKSIVQKAQAEANIYTINESWTIDVLQKFPALRAFSKKLLMVDKKQISDIQRLIQSNIAKDVLIVGDGTEQELSYAKDLEIDAINVRVVDDFVAQVGQELRIR